VTACRSQVGAPSPCPFLEGTDIGQEGIEHTAQEVAPRYAPQRVRHILPSADSGHARRFQPLAATVGALWTSYIVLHSRNYVRAWLPVGSIKAAHHSTGSIWDREGPRTITARCTPTTPGTICVQREEINSACPDSSAPAQR
jgi:hypothetical protein